MFLLYKLGKSVLDSYIYMGDGEKKRHLQVVVFSSHSEMESKTLKFRNIGNNQEHENEYITLM
jgi:hypothetical protein